MFEKKNMNSHRSSQTGTKKHSLPYWHKEIEYTKSLKSEPVDSGARTVEHKRGQSRRHMNRGARTKRRWQLETNGRPQTADGVTHIWASVHKRKGMDGWKWRRMEGHDWRLKEIWWFGKTVERNSWLLSFGHRVVRCSRSISAPSNRHIALDPPIFTPSMA